jgi:hypothetical protein
MRLDILIARLESLRAIHGNCQILLDHEDATGVEFIEEADDCGSYVNLGCQ